MGVVVLSCLLALNCLLVIVCAGFCPGPGRSPNLEICTSQTCMNYCFYLEGKPAAVANVQSKWPYFPWGDNPTLYITGSWIAYTGHGFSGDSQVLSSWNGPLGNYIGFRSVGESLDYAASTITFFQLEGYRGNPTEPISQNKAFSPNEVYRSYAITGNSNWLISFRPIETPDSIKRRIPICATPGFFRSYFGSEYPVESVTKGCDSIG